MATEEIDWSGQRENVESNEREFGILVRMLSSHVYEDANTSDVFAL